MRCSKRKRRLLRLAVMVVVELHVRIQRGGKNRDTLAGFLWFRGNFLGNVNNIQGFIGYGIGRYWGSFVRVINGYGLVQ
jgi:hypothetical protein